LSCGVIGWLLLQMPPEEAISVAALVSVSVAVYVMRALLRRASGKVKPAVAPLEP
jgi:hypothetical protein